MAAELGLDATGIDSSARAIARAEQKAKDRNLAPRFLVDDALELETRNEHYETVLDCGLFHTFDDHDRATFVRNLKAILLPGGCYFMLCFSDQQPGEWGPRRVSRAEIESSFADGWHINSCTQSRIEITLDPEGAFAWLVSATRIEESLG
jgi:cyclopropane fatty-acyl-phospholipid synthase-like methyltransferase